MRFAAAAIALSGAAMAAYPAADVYPTEKPSTSKTPDVYPTTKPESSTVYSTEYHTLTSYGAGTSSTKVTSSVYPLTTSTVYATTTKTITSCKAEVTYCPAESTKVVTSTYAVSTTVCPVYPPEKPATYPPSKPTTYPPGKPSEKPTTYPPGKPSEKPTTYPTVKPSEKPTEKPYPTEKPACPTYSVKTISTSVTTVVPTVIYETVQVPCPTATGKPVPSSYPVGGGNATYPTGKPPVTAGAANLAVSGLLAAAAGLAAVALL